MVSAAKTNQEMKALRVDYADLAPDPSNSVRTPAATASLVKWLEIQTLRLQILNQNLPPSVAVGFWKLSSKRHLSEFSSRTWGRRQAGDVTKLRAWMAASLPCKWAAAQGAPHPGGAHTEGSWRRVIWWKMKKGDVFGWLWQGAWELMGSQEASFPQNVLSNNPISQNKG